MLFRSKIHFDIWAPEDSYINLTIESLSTEDGGSGYKQGVEFALKEGWNRIDTNMSQWKSYDWKDVKYRVSIIYI